MARQGLGRTLRPCGRPLVRGHNLCHFLQSSMHAGGCCALRIGQATLAVVEGNKPRGLMGVQRSSPGENDDLPKL